MKKTSPKKPASQKTKTKTNERKQNPQAVQLQKIFAEGISYQDRGNFLVQDIAAISNGFIDFAQTRKSGKAQVKVFNPNQAHHDYVSKHTVIMIANDDMPFLVDSTVGELTRMGLSVHLILHPILTVTRNTKNELASFSLTQNSDASENVESWMYIEIDETPESKQLAEIEKNIEKTLQLVRQSVDDWAIMRSRVVESITALPHNNVAGLPAGEREEAAAFLAWIESDQFTFLGMRDYKVKGSGKNKHLVPDTDSGLGILKNDVSVLFFSEDGEGTQPSDIHLFLERKQLILITKTHKNSRVHRTTPMDAILIKQFDTKGELIGERLFVGLFTSSAHACLPTSIPLIRNKIDYVVEKANFNSRSHNAKALSHILNSYPRDELFQISEKGLYETAMGIIQLQERQRVALFVRHDAFDRFVSCLVYLPREAVNSRLRKNYEEIFLKTFNGISVTYNLNVSNDPLSQILFVVRTRDGKIPAYNHAALEKALHETSRGWQGLLQDALVTAFGENRGLGLNRRYLDAFPDTYRDSVSAQDALVDIAFIEDVSQSKQFALHLYKVPNSPDNQICLKWYNPDGALSLSQILPLIEDMGLAPDAEYGPYAATPEGAGVPVWIHDCHAHVRDNANILPINTIKEKFEECLFRVWRGEAESDSYNRLVLLAGLSWREVVVLRAVGKYLRQLGISSGDSVLKSTLAAHPKAAQLLVELFLTRHDPAKQKQAAKECTRIENDLKAYLRNVNLAEHDRVLRRFLNVIQNTLRTNYFQTTKEGAFKPCLSFKVDSKNIDEMPLPRMHVEIFVYSPKVEGIHLRGGKVARGGIRWSDRREDFRTEVLGLVKAQMVKNTVIVPVGSKGGFVVKTPTKPADFYKEGVACYQAFIGALLDITDNRKGNKIVPPTDVVRHDGDDPYLVVAADKGTAKFSDIANAISVDRGFWLGDAFASGGSAGYDHKGMGITARGAWEAVKRHFREMGKDIQKDDFTVIGVGDMSGDVFGNGMLLSKHILLQGAFNHKHIFIDPTPDTANSFKERQRLFDLPTSQWADYNKKLISKGGGIYDRDAKTINLSKEARELFGLGNGELKPDDVIRAMLKSPTELLWFGGIGTYVKAQTESHGDAGDRANDDLRVNAEELQAAVIGEGANLGLTQRARIAFARKNGRINTDAIDNSAGVDTSDHEVNIKILLDPVVKRGDLNTAERNKLLAKMTDDVGKLVLRDNYLQSQAISIAEHRATDLLPEHARLITQLERIGLLNRRVEYLPNDDEISDRLRAGQGLTRPELAVLMAYAKIALYDDLLASSLPDNPALESDLFLYFPKLLQEKHPEDTRNHRLRREIIATFTTNSVINRGGIHFINRIKEKTGKSAQDIAGAYALVRNVFDLRQMWRDTEALDGKVAGSVQIDLFTRMSKMIERASEWYLANADLKQSAEILAKHKKSVTAARAWLEKHDDLLFGDPSTRERLEQYREAGVPENLIRNIMLLPLLVLVLEIAALAETTGHKLEAVTELYFAVESRFSLNKLRRMARKMPVENHWQREANILMIDDLYKVQSSLAKKILGKSKGKNVQIGKDVESFIAAWIESQGLNIQSFDRLVTEITNAPRIHTAQLNLVLRQLQPWAA